MPFIADNELISQPQNVNTEFRESFETFDTTNTWQLTTGSGDIIQLDGNAASCSYLVISKDPLTVGTESILVTRAAFVGPFETSVGLSMSQRVLGQETAMELVSTGTPLPTPSELSISSITQATTTLTVVTTAAHGLSSGTRIGIYEVTSDSRLNYPSLVVASIVDSTTFTCTAGPGGTIPSLSVGPYLTQGKVYFRSALGLAPEGMSEIYENATATNASFYVRSDSGDALPSGTAAGNQSVTIATTASVQVINGANTYAFNPSAEYKFQFQTDKISFFDSTIDSTVQPTTRLNRTSVLPLINKTYKLRFRFTNNKGLTIPNAKIVSAVKAGSTTATINTAAAHGLTTGDWILIYGIRDQTNFANQTTAVQVASTPTTTSLTVAFGASATATSYGGMVSRGQGGNVPASFPNLAVQSVSSTTTALTVVSSANWGWLIGDYVNVYGIRDNATGADLGFDGTYKVSNVATTTLTLIPIGSTVLPAPLGTTDAGGTVIKRTDTRISFARIFQYLRERVEVLAKSDLYSAIPVAAAGGAFAATQSGTWSVIPINSNTYSLLTTTTLAGAATYTGSTLTLSASTTSSSVYNTAFVIGVQHTAGLVPGTLIYEIGTETSSTAPTTWYPQLTMPIPSNTTANWTTFTIPVSTRYGRFRFINGATAQTSFRLAYLLMYNGALGNDLTFPDYLMYPLSVTALAGAAAFTSAALNFGETNWTYKKITATAYADQASATNGLQIQVSRDNSNWRVIAQATVSASTLTTLTADIVYQYVRIVYTNGATLQGVFALDARAEVA